jgi:hypothetical protein
MDRIDLNNPPANHRVDLSLSPEETPGERQLRLWKDGTVFYTAWLACVLIVGYAAWTAVGAPDIDADTKRWAMSIVSAAAGGLLGFLVRK